VGALRADTIHPSWRDVVDGHRAELDAISSFLVDDGRGGHTVLPPPESVFRAFAQPMDAVRVVIVGQDPYPTLGHAMGLSFSVDRAVKPLPRSLANIYRELHSDLGIDPAQHGDLSNWARQGVLLLNRVLTVRGGEAGSHRQIGWEAVTASALTALARRGGPLVAILWGADARSAEVLLGDVPVIASAHPSPLSAHRGFFGSRPFSRANELLTQQGSQPIDWRV
jgi:uracil-DNA glycosylase